MRVLSGSNEWFECLKRTLGVYDQRTWIFEISYNSIVDHLGVMVFIKPLKKIDDVLIDKIKAHRLHDIVGLLNGESVNEIGMA